MERGALLRARLCFAQGLHRRLAAGSPIEYLSEDLVKRVISLLRELVEVPGTTCGGAHTDNPQYYAYRDGSLVLKTVCWLHVGIQAQHVPAGRYAVQFHVSAGANQSFDLSTTTSVRNPSTGGEWVECCAAYTWSPGRKKGRGVLSLGEVTLDAESDVYVQQKNTNSGWKGSTSWHKLVLVPLPARAPAVKQGWATAEDLKALSSREKKEACVVIPHRMPAGAGQSSVPGGPVRAADADAEHGAEAASLLAPGTIILSLEASQAARRF